MKRILGIDYGSARIGLALSDPTQTLASRLSTLRTARTLAATVTAVLNEVQTLDIEAIVVGLPLFLSGRESATTAVVRAFADLLREKSGLPVFLQDERLTSKEVERVLIDSHMKRKKRAKHLDELSATLILQTYLDILDSRQEKMQNEPQG
ncbi:MAG: Holliday junction resolvase RuvX [Chlamydiota bacterium]